MYINLHTLMKLPVYTESGTKVGVVHDLEIDIATHSIRHYIVEHGLIGKNQYWVAPAQVKSVTSEKMIVDDTILTDPALKVARGDVTTAAVVGGAMSNSLH